MVNIEESKRQKKWSAKVKTGCWTCKQRRVKCDERKPSCGNCQKVGRQCQGYPARDATQPERHAQQLRALAPAPGSTQVPIQYAQIKAMEDVQVLYSIMPQLLATPSSSKNSWSMRSSMRTTTAVYLAFLPSRAGQSAVMDAAVRCLAAAVRLYYTKSRLGESIAEQDQGLILGPYNHALKCLRQALKDPKESVSAETLCAAELLCCFESFYSDGTDEAQARHLIGIEEVIKHRKPNRFTTEFDLQLIQSQLGYSVFKAFFTSTSSFLNQGEWVPVLEMIGSLAPPLKLLMDYFILSAPVLEVLKQTTDLMSIKDISSAEALETRSRLLGDLTKSANAFIKWYWDVIDLIYQYIGGASVESDRHNLSKRRRTVCQVSQFFGTCQTVIVIGNRLHAVLSGEDGYPLEIATQETATRLVYAYNLEGDDMTNPTIFESSVMKAIIATRDEWHTYTSTRHGLQSRDVFPKDIFFGWLTAMGVSYPPLTEA